MRDSTTAILPSALVKTSSPSQQHDHSNDTNNNIESISLLPTPTSTAAVRTHEPLFDGVVEPNAPKSFLSAFVLLPALIGFVLFYNYYHPLFQNKYTKSKLHPPLYMLNDSVPPTILISIDGFRHDYLDRKSRKDGKPLAPTLLKLSEEGVRALPGMLPVMPSTTFPNHWSLVTGLFPESHGIIGNTMYSPITKTWFHYSGSDPHWWSGEPIWQTLQNTKRNISSNVDLNYTTGAVFWVGSDVEKHLPDAYWVYDGSVSYEKRINRVVDLLTGNTKDLGMGKAAQFVTLYFEGVDTEGHAHGPDSEEVDHEIIKVDNAINKLLKLINDSIPVDVNIIIVSDHGMTEMSSDNRIHLNSFIEEGSVQDVEQSPFGTWINYSITEKQLYDEMNNAFKENQHAKVYKKMDIPDRWHLKHSQYVTNVVTLADLGWSVNYPHQHLLRQQQKARIYGDHGFDNEEHDMQAVFIANGPSFRNAATVTGFTNVDLYELICSIFSATPAPNNGSLDISKSYILKP